MYNWVVNIVPFVFCFKLKIDQKGLMGWLGWSKLLWVLFQPKKMAKKEYRGNEGLGLAWDRMKCPI